MLILEIPKIELTGGHIAIMLIIEILKIELTGGHIGIMLIIEIPKLESTGGHIAIMLIIDIPKLELTVGHIGIMLIIYIPKIFRDGNSRFRYLELKLDYPGPYFFYALYRERKIKTGFPGGNVIYRKGESNSNISISLNSLKTIWPPENRSFKSPFLVFLA